MNEGRFNLFNRKKAPERNESSEVDPYVLEAFAKAQERAVSFIQFAAPDVKQSDKEELAKIIENFSVEECAKVLHPYDDKDPSERRYQTSLAIDSWMRVAISNAFKELYQGRGEAPGELVQFNAALMQFFAYPGKEKPLYDDEGKMGEF
jgi:hypothetical protein